MTVNHIVKSHVIPVKDDERCKLIFPGSADKVRRSIKEAQRMVDARRT